MTSNIRPSQPRKSIRGLGWKTSRTIAQDKYETISTAVLESLSKEPMRYSDLVAQVKKTVSNFDGSIAWYVMSCLRELEVQGRITKHQRPVRYSAKLRK